jgi:uncharacterized protein
METLQSAPIGQDRLGCLSACPGGDCSVEHSSGSAACYLLIVEILRAKHLPNGWTPPSINGYDQSHGV